MFEVILNMDSEMFFITYNYQEDLIKKSKLWCVFVDYQRAFDSVNRDALSWTKLIQADNSCKMTNMMKCIYYKLYYNVQSCVKISSTMQMSECFGSEGRRAIIYLTFRSCR
jgi:hypothetical protein